MDFSKMSHYELKKLHDTVKRQNNIKYQENSKQRAMRSINKKIETTMIGSLARFEEEFGELWGHNKDYDDLTEEEKFWFKKWQSVRTAILNNGNNQIRASFDELSQYTMTWNRYKTQFIIRKEL